MTISPSYAPSCLNLTFKGSVFYLFFLHSYVVSFLCSIYFLPVISKTEKEIEHTLIFEELGMLFFSPTGKLVFDDRVV